MPKQPPVPKRVAVQAEVHEFREEVEAIIALDTPLEQRRQALALNPRMHHILAALNDIDPDDDVSELRVSLRQTISELVTTIFPADQNPRQETT